MIHKTFGPNTITWETEEETAIKSKLAKTKIQTEIVILLVKGNKYEAEMRANETKYITKAGFRGNCILD